MQFVLDMSLRFIPHQLHARPVTYAPPQPTAFPQGIQTAAVAAAALAANSGPRFQPIPSAGQRPQPGSAVIEAAPTRYTAGAATGKNDSRQSTAQAVAAPEPIRYGFFESREVFLLQLHFSF